MLASCDQASRCLREVVLHLRVKGRWHAACREHASELVSEAFDAAVGEPEFEACGVTT